jgi:transposase InsO family protein
MNERAEEGTLVGLNKLFERYQSRDYKDKEKQKILCSILTKKMDQDDAIRCDMEQMKTPDTVDKWIENYKQARANARQVLKKAGRYKYLQNDLRDYKAKNQRGKVDSDHSDSNRKELLKRKRHDQAEQESPVIDWTKKRCYGCGKEGHGKEDCWQMKTPNPHPDRNQENTDFHKSAKGIQWIANTHGPYCHQFWHLDGTKRTVPKPENQSKFEVILCSVIDRLLLNKPIHSDFLPVFLSLPQNQTLAAEGEEAGGLERVEEVHSPGVKMAEAGAEEAVADKLVQALLDTGCLVGDCISQEVVNSLNARHLVVNIKTTICSGFDNHCSDIHPSLLIKITFIHENTFLKESFIRRVYILPKSPVDIIIGRKTIKDIDFNQSTPSHFSWKINSTSTSQHVQEVPFGENTQEILGSITSNQVMSKRLSKGLMSVREHAHTCEGSLTLRTTAGSKTDSENIKQTVRGDDSMGQSLCLCRKALPQSSRGERIYNPFQSDKALDPRKGIPDLAGLQDSSLLATVLGCRNLIPNGNVPEWDWIEIPQASGNRRSVTWQLQEDGSYKLVPIEKPEYPIVSSMIHRSSEESSRLRGSQSWGIIATLIKQSDQLNEEQTIRAEGNSQDVYISEMHAPDENTGDATTTDSDDTLNTEHDVFKEFMHEELDPQVDPLDLIAVEGSPGLRVKIRILLEKYRSVFATTLSEEPANIPPFELDVDKEKWESYKNRGPPRVQSPAKQAEILKQVTELLDRGIIEHSTAEYYSQVILASKPDDTWRFCIDYRSLNDCTRSASWPIPNIREMFSRLGTHHSNIFGVMDLTAGYHQAPVGLGTRVFLAFICFCGLFQFCRLPFGPKRAPSYFQQMMSSVVLVGLLYFICEMYLDDCIVHGNGEDQFLERLEQVLQRFSERNIFLKPSKCKFGMTKVEYCGKEISENGLSMSKKKIRKVLDFPKPHTAGQMKQFVGLVNYFHDFVPHHSQILKPLHDMIQNYQKKTRGRILLWSKEGEESFHKIIKEIEKGHTMFFPREDCPIFLMTDACDYGIGGYCYQLVDNKEQAVALVSKALNDTQYKWSILQKEAYAIFYCLKQLLAILRDRHFTVQCDNRGYVFMRTDSNPMVYRWMVDTQEFDFSVEDILGINNPVADGFSRLVQNNMTPELITSLLPPQPIPEYISILIGMVHNSVSGHHGFERTLRMLTTPSSADSNITLINKPIQFLRQHIKQFIKMCPCCQKMSMIKIPIHAHPFTTSTYLPMQCLNIDFVGPYPDGGYVMVIIDTFTRWVELFASQAADAKNASLNLFQHFGRFGAPAQIRSDRGSHFANETITQFLAMVGTEHCLTLAYSSQQNAIVERIIKEVNRHVTALTFETNSVDDYAMLLPIVQRILNSAYSDHTKISSAQLLFGNALNLDRGLFLTPAERPDINLPLSDHISKLLRLQDEMIKKARKVLTTSDEEHMALFPKKPTQYLPDTYVLVKYRKGTPPTRLHTNWKGPLRVISNDQSEYLLYDLITDKAKPYHVSDMKPFMYDPLKTNPVDIARRDYLEFFVEKILGMTGDIKKVTTVKFLVKWLGFDDASNSWEPWKNVRDTEQVHVYLTANNLGRYIPKKFKTNT